MSASFYDLLKYAATGQASPSMTYYDRMRASMLMGGAVQTLTGIPPLSFNSDGTPLISWSMSGNGSQSDTPTPDNPVMPTFCGVRTANLWNEEYTNISATPIYKPLFVGDGYFTLSTDFERFNNATDIFLLSGSVSSGINSSTNGAYNGKSITAQSIDGYVTVAYRKYARAGDGAITNCKTMLNSGSTALPYEPFGYKIPITCAGQTTPVYLGQVSTVRRIKKFVLTGEEQIGNYDATYSRFSIFFSDSLILGLRKSPVISSHLIGISDGRGIAGVPNNAIYSDADSGYGRWFIKTTDYTTVADFKAFLAAQYAAGHPVTVWYVLAEPETAIVNEPLAKIGDYADELHSEDAGVTIPTVKGANTLTVDTELQPSSMTITYKS